MWTPVDRGHTVQEWPVALFRLEDVPATLRKRAEDWTGGSLVGWKLIYAPRRRTDPKSFAYLLGYQGDRVCFAREDGTENVEADRRSFTEVSTHRELLNADVTLHWDGRSLAIPYVPSVYYLFDPFLNWALELQESFLPILAEQASPRPQSLYEESLPLYNYALAAYRLGPGFSDYTRRAEKHRSRWLPWKVTWEEWLEVPMARGQFSLHIFRYLVECTYRPDREKTK